MPAIALAEDPPKKAAEPKAAQPKAPVAEKPAGNNVIKNVLEGVLGGRKPVARPQPVDAEFVEPLPAPIVVRGFIGGAFIGQAAPQQHQSKLEKLAPTPGLNTNEELERLLDQADKLVAANRADLAPALWQKVLDEGAAVLAAQRTGTVETVQHIYQSYRPLTSEAEARITASGSTGLKAYRLQANGRARLLLGNAAPDEIDFDQRDARERTLHEVVQRYFLSTSGDNAAFELACRLLEQENYIPAASLLFKLQSHPDNDVPEPEIAARLIVALARSGVTSAAEELFASKSGLIDPEARTLIRADLDRFKSAAPQAAQTAALISDPLAAMKDGSFALKWSYQPHFQLKKTPQRQQPNRGVSINVQNGRQIIMEIDERGQRKELQTDISTWPDMTRAELATQWTSRNWTPASNALLTQSRVLVKSQERLVCCDRESGKVVWMGRKTKFPIDPAVEQAQTYEMIGWRMASNSPTRPKTVCEARLFGDRLAHAVAVAEDVVINIEGELDYGSKIVPLNNEANEAAFHFDVNNVPCRINYLSGYDLRTGKLRWQRGLNDNPEQREAAAVSVPLATKRGVLIAAIANRKLEVVLLDGANGTTIWRSTVLEAVPVDSEVWAPLALETDSDSLFVSTGFGCAFALKLATGQIEWASAYPRKMTEIFANMQRMMGHGQPLTVPPNPAAPQANVIKHWGPLLIVIGADSDQAMAFDRRSGTLRWEAPLAPNGRQPCRDVLGIHENLLVVSGPNVVRGYDLSGGRLRWENSIGTITGRGLVTREAIYVPQGDRIVRLDPQTGVELNSLKPATIDGLPMGNLMTDGKQLFVTGPGVVLALTPTAATTEEK